MNINPKDFLKLIARAGGDRGFLRTFRNDLERYVREHPPLPQATHSPVPRPARFRRGFAALFAAAALVLAGGATTYAARASVPGDMLYPVKLATERARISMAGSSAAKMKLAKQFAEARMAELRFAHGAGAAEPALRNFDADIGRVVSFADALAKEGKVQEALDVTQYVRASTRLYERVLPSYPLDTQEKSAASAVLQKYEHEAEDRITSIHDENDQGVEAGGWAPGAVARIQDLNARIGTLKGELTAASKMNPKAEAVRRAAEGKITEAEHVLQGAKDALDAEDFSGSLEKARESQGLVEDARAVFEIGPKLGVSAEDLEEATTTGGDGTTQRKGEKGNGRDD